MFHYFTFQLVPFCLSFFCSTTSSTAVQQILHNSLPSGPSLLRQEGKFSGATVACGSNFEPEKKLFGKMWKIGRPRQGKGRKGGRGFLGEAIQHPVIPGLQVQTTFGRRRRRSSILRINIVCLEQRRYFRRSCYYLNYILVVT